MKTYRVGGFLILALICGYSLVGGGDVHAQSLSPAELEGQVTKLQSGIEALTRVLRVGGEEVPTDVDVVRVRPCPVFTRSLSRGMSGDDVRSLQEYLRTEGHFTDNATGYFGSMTKAAVARWQSAEGISSLGIMGPRSLTRVKERCGITPLPPPVSPPVLFKATPTRGTAPLTVTFSTWISGFRAPHISHTLDFGDGTSVTPMSCLAPADACIAPGDNEHTYTKNGTYTATLYRITDPCHGNSLCMAPVQRESLGTVDITVGGQACTREYKPVCGSKPIVCVTTPCDPIQQTYGNSCSMKADGATLLYTGECRVATQNKSPVISSFMGPTTLAVGAKGTWKIKASDPENGVLTYAISWGDDEVYGLDSMRSGMAPMSVRQTSTFTHSYSNPGEYTVKITVTDESGGEAETTTTVTVTGEIACPTIFDPVCGRPIGCGNTCGPGMYCTMMCQMPEPVTYGNVCVLNASGADFSPQR